MTTGTWTSRPSLGTSEGKTASYTNDSSNIHPEFDFPDAAPDLSWDVSKIPFFVGDGVAQPAKLILSGALSDYWTRTAIAGQALIKMSLQIDAPDAVDPYKEHQIISTATDSLFG